MAAFNEASENHSEYVPGTSEETATHQTDFRLDEWAEDYGLDRDIVAALKAEKFTTVGSLLYMQDDDVLDMELKRGQQRELQCAIRKFQVQSGGLRIQKEANRTEKTNQILKSGCAYRSPKFKSEHKDVPLAIHFDLWSKSELLREGYETQTQDHMDAVFATLSKDMDVVTDTVIFDQVKLDVRGTYVKEKGTFCAFEDGDYWVAMSMGTKPATDSYTQLIRDDTMIASAYCPNYSDGRAEDTVSRDIIVSLSKFQGLAYKSKSALFSDQGLQTSMAIFRLSSLMDKSVWFSAVRTSDHKGSDNETVPFDIVLVCQGDAPPMSQHFKVPQNGIYFLSYSIGAWQGEATTTWLRRNGVILGTLAKLSTVNAGVETVSRGGLYQLKKGDIISISIDKAHRVVSAPGENHTSFSGFLYDPKHGPSIAWSVAKHSSWQNNQLSLYTIPFDEVLVNEGGCWKKDKHIFVVPVTGIYYITVTVGVQAGKCVDVGVIIDWQVKLRLTRYSTKHNGNDMMCRSAIFHLQAGSWVAVNAEANTGIYSTAERHTTFSGLLLFLYDPED